MIEAEGHATDLFTDWVRDCLKERGQTPDQPFFLDLAYNAPHFPIEPPPSWLHRVQSRDPSLDPKRAASVAFVEHLDDQIGRLLKSLQENGLEENTLVVFTSDNGGSLPHAQSNAPWRDGKQIHYDGGLRVPFAMRWPAQIAANSRSDYAGLIFDLFPTFLELARASLSDDLDAVSLVPLLHGKPLPTDRELYFVRREGGAYGGKSYEALIRGDWKLMQNDPFSPLELYQLRDDPQETKNQIATHPGVARDLLGRLRKHVQRGGTAPWQAPNIPNVPDE